MANKQHHIFISGVVQGVGFRFITKAIANRHNIKGWVRNLSDGRVELLVQGDENNLSNFLKVLKSEFKQNISDFELYESSEGLSSKDFQIQF